MEDMKFGVLYYIDRFILNSHNKNTRKLTIFDRGNFMLAVKSMDARDNFKEWCNKVINGETLIVSGPKNENVVIVSEEEYNNLQRAL